VYFHANKNKSCANDFWNTVLYLGDNVIQMKTIILSVLVSGLLFAAGGPIPRKAAEFRIHDASQKGIPLSQYAGKTVVLAFVLTDCLDCQATTRALNAVAKDYAGLGVQVLESALDKMASVRIGDFQKKFGTTFPVGFNDSQEAARFLGYPPGVPIQMPVIVFIDKSGTIRAQFDNGDKDMGARDSALKYTMTQGSEPPRPAARPPAPKK
jgi:peroxiredoxin